MGHSKLGSDDEFASIDRQLQAKLVQEELDRRGWNQSDLGRATKLPRYTISRIVRGQVPISRENAHRIALALDLDPHAFFQMGTRSAAVDLVEGIQSTTQPDGMVRVRANLLVQPGVHLAIEALAAYEQPMRTDRLAHVLNALVEPLPSSKNLERTK